MIIRWSSCHRITWIHDNQQQIIYCLVVPREMSTPYNNWVSIGEFGLSAPALWNSGSVPPPRGIRAQCPRPVEFRLSAPAPWVQLNITSLVECPRQVKFRMSAPATRIVSSSAPATCISRGGGTEVEFHLAGDLSTGRGHWTRVAGALSAYLYHRYRWRES